MERLTKYLSIAEVISVVLFLLCLLGGLFLDTGFWLRMVCEVVANVCWVTTEISIIGLIVVLLIYSLQLFMKLTRNPGGMDSYGMLQTPEEQKKRKMPWFWVVLAFAWFFVFWVIVMPLMAAGA